MGPGSLSSYKGWSLWQQCCSWGDARVQTPPSLPQDRLLTRMVMCQADCAFRPTPNLRCPHCPPLTINPPQTLTGGQPRAGLSQAFRAKEQRACVFGRSKRLKRLHTKSATFNSCLSSAQWSWPVGCREANNLEYGFGILLDANSCSKEKTASLSVTTRPSPAPQPCHPARSPRQGRVEGGPERLLPYLL